MSKPWSPPSVHVELRRDAGRVAPGRSPWFRRDEIARVLGAPDPHALAIVHDAKGNVLAYGTHSPTSAIVVRVLAWGPTPPRLDWLRARIEAALRARALLGLSERAASEGGAEHTASEGGTERARGHAAGHATGHAAGWGMTTGYREINSEGDGLPGLTVDRYGDTRVVVLGTAPMVVRRDEVLAVLATLAPTSTTLVLQPESAAKREGFAADASRTPAIPAEEPVPPLRWLEHGLRFTAPAPPSQKTGAYHDQRDNRRFVAERAATAFTATGRGMLDLGCHVGGFAIAAAKRGVPVVAADRSALALEFTRQNAADNDVAALVTTVQAEMFGPLGGPSLDDALAGPFSCIVFDPPKLATNARERERALAAMEAVLVQLQARLVPGGLLVVCSCSAAIGRGELATLAVRTASRSGRAITQSFERGPGDDHPIQPGHDEGRYLTVMGWRVD